MYIRKSVLRGMEHNEFMIGKALRFWGGGVGTCLRYSTLKEVRHMQGSYKGLNCDPS